MVWRKVAHIALGCTLLLAFQLYGVAELIRNEPPRGSLFGVVYSERTLAPIPKALVRLELIEPFGAQPRPEPLPEAETTQRHRRQGWRDLQWYEGECYGLSPLNTWEVYTDAQGRFQLRGIPAGVYLVYASGKVHSVDFQDPPRIEIREGTRVDTDLALKPREPFLDLIHPQSVYYPDEPLRMGIRGFNAEDTLRLTLYRVRNIRQATPADLHDFLQEVRNGWWRPEDQLTQAMEQYQSSLTPIWEQEVPIRGRDPEGVFTQYVEVPKQPEGTYLLQVESGANRRVGLMVVSSVAVMSKVSPEVTEFWCTDLRTGQPVSGAEIAVYQARSQGAGNHQQIEYEPMRTGRTNADGLCRFPSFAQTKDDHWRGQLVAVKSPRTGQLIYWGRIDAAPWIGESGQGEPLHGVIYTERPIYRPGHTIHFKGIARLGNILNYKLPPPDTPVQISVVNPRDEVVYETRTQLNRLGAFHGSFTISPEAETGVYRIQARIGDYGVIEGSLPISAYRKPTYRITVKSDRELYMPNETVRVQIHTDYYFGMPVPNTQLSYTLYRREKWNWDYYEDDYDYLDWGDEYEYYGGGAYGEVVKTGELTTDSAGRANLILRSSDLIPSDREQRPLYWDGSNISYEYTLEVHALSEGWEGAKAQADFEIATSVWHATLRPDVEFGESGRTYRYTVRLTDRRTGQPVQTTLRWQAGKQLATGNRFRFEPRFEGAVQTNAQGVAEFQFIPDVRGDWEVQITARDPDGNPFKTRHILWIWDDDYLPWWWERLDANALETRLNKRVFEPGETAELALRTPYRDAVFYITLEGDRLYQSQVVKARGALTRIRIPLTHKQIPNAYISVCMVRNKELVQRTVEVRVGPRVGALQVKVQTDKPRYEPGETLTARIQTTDIEGRPTPAEVSLAVVDEAIYSIREDRPNAVYRAFYAPSWNAVQTDFSALWLALQGDKGSVETIRRDFPDTAFWQPTITTDARGQATVRLKLPDNLTEWRLTAIAHTADTKIGFAHAQVKTAKDLMARLRLPMWLVEGDRTQISAILSNDTDQPRTVQVELRAPDGVRTRTVAVPARNSITLSWDYEARELGVQKFTLFARESGGRLQDAEERTLEIKPLAINEIDSRAVLLNTERQISLTLRPDARPEQVTLTLRSMPSITAIALDSLPYLMDYPYGCVEQTVSRFVPAVLTQRVCEQAGVPLDAKTRRKIAEITQNSLERLRRMQMSDGGWGWWEGEESTLWTTAYAVWGLHKAKRAGVKVPDSLYQRGVDALRRLLVTSLAQAHSADPNERIDLSTPEWLFLLSVLAEVDPTPPDTLRYSDWIERAIEHAILPPPSERNNSFLQSVQHRRIGLIHILLRWRNLPNAEQHLKRLWDACLSDALEERSTIDWSPNRTDEPWWNWCDWSSTETQALALQALLLSRERAAQWFGNPNRYEQLVSKTVTGLALGYRNGRWYQSRDTALAIEALLSYSARYERNFAAREAEYEVRLNGQPIQRVSVAAFSTRRFMQPLTLKNLAWRPGVNIITLRPLRGAPLVSVVFQQARNVPLQETPTAPLQLRVYRLERPNELEIPGEQLRPLRSGDTVRAGELLRIDVEARMPQKVSRLEYTVLETPFAAGCAPFDTEAFLSAWWWDYAHEEIRDDRSLAFRQYWIKGESYRYTLLVRAETPGEYTILPAHLWGMYAPYQAYSNGFKLRIRGN
ncbi:MAG: hypothetical protein KatS3mg017_0951 [Fimbriimonadales bacterium]|nr:MAG: hypothetical protein KatS3mg017_0434 [Fimbriimonadales bacterium]GIV07749.1 MAG: hypothetical protein KatS3mg017_0951 [Fimbriimonadales bacterium]